jgi:hypothetical protein
MVRKKFDKTVIDKIVEKFTKNTNHEFFKKFIEMFPRKKEFNHAEWDEGLSGKAWYPEGELWLLKQLFGIDFDNDGSKGELNTEHWCDFYNELVQNNW